MNCSQLDTFITDLARHQLGDEDGREKLLAHADQCPTCAARLAEQRTLTSTLDAMRIASREAVPSPQTELTLRAAFRERAARNATTTTTIASPLPFANRGRKSIKLWLGYLPQTAAAALAVTLLTLGVFRLADRSDQSPESTPHTVVTPDASRGGFTDGNSAPTFTSAVSADHSPAALNSPTTRRNAGASRSAARHSAAAIRVKAARDDFDSRAGEMTTDFLPLTYAAGVEPLDRGHVVRVELPRSALTTMGLPMNAERAGERIEADVLLGEDGIARAIRFVR